LVRGGSGGIRMKMKNVSNMGGVPEVLRNINFGSLTLKITQIIRF
jgi:hypothetical protein